MINIQYLFLISVIKENKIFNDNYKEFVFYLKLKYILNINIRLIKNLKFKIIQKKKINSQN